ncbi:MAG: tetratricopeptide repeat protein, partial [Acidobacteriota bacterium]|nr:tetratricopeptide repeat protein [Acidobacteriota bacterium]
SVDAGMHREIVYLLSDSLIKLERGEDALAVVSSAAGANWVEGANLDQRRLQLKRAEILETLDRGEEAAAIVAGIAESPDRSAALLLVNYYQRQTRFEAMIPILRDALDATPSADEAALEVDLYFSLGMAYERTGKFSEADEAFREVLTREPEDDRTLNYLGYMWAERGERLDEALSLIERAVAIEPDNPAYVDSLGWAHYRLGNYDRARDSLEYAARLLPEDATILEHLGDLYVALEFPEKARELYRRAVARNDENVEGVRRKLSELGLGGS